MVGAGGDDIPWFQRVDRGYPLDHLRDLMGHIAGMKILHQGAVDPQAHGQLVRIGHFISGDEPWSERRKRLSRLHLKEGIAIRFQPAGRHINEIEIAEDVVIGIGRLHVRGALANHQPELGFVLEDRCRYVGK